MKKIISLLLATVMVFSLAACSQKTGEKAGETRPENREIVIASGDWTEGIDLCQAGWWPDCCSLIAEPLFYREANGTLTPRMCTKCEIAEDGSTITMTLADDLKFHDGTPVTPQDVKRSIEWAQEVSLYAADFANVESVSVDGQDITLHLSVYTPTVLYYMGFAFWPTIKASDIDSMTPEELRWNATTYGPYYVDEYVAGSHLILKRNEYFKTYNEHVENKGVCPIETIKVRFMEDSFAIVQGLLAHEVDYGYGVTQNDLEQIAADSALKYEWTDTTAIFRLLINPVDELFSDENVRKAVSLLLDREKLAEFSDGSFSPAYAYSCDIMLDHDPAAEEYYKTNWCNNPDAGLKLLKESGWADTDSDGYLDKDGRKLEFTVYYCDDAQKQIFELMQVVLKDYGVQVNGQMVDGGTFFESVTPGGDYQTALNVFAWGDTASTLPYIIPDYSVVDYEAFAGDVFAASTIVDEAERATAFGQLQRQLMDTGCVLPVVSARSLTTYNTETVGTILYDANGMPLLNDAK